MYNRWQREGMMSGIMGTDVSSKGAPPIDDVIPVGDAAALLKVATALRAYLQKNPELREALRGLLEFVLAEAPDDSRTVEAASQTQSIPQPPEPVERVSLTLKIGGISRDIAVPPAVGPSGNRHLDAPLAGPRVVMRESSDVPGLLPATREGIWDQSPRVDGKKVAARCRLKAEGCRWAIEQHRLVHGGVPHTDERIRDARESLVARAKAINPCYLWMIDPRGPALPDDPTLGDLAECYDAVAQTIDLVGEASNPEDEDASGNGALERAMTLAAEAQCMLRCSLTPVGFDDHDQTQAHVLLRQLADERRVLIRRFMRLTETAPIERVEDLKREAAEEAAQRRANSERSRRRRALFSKARYHAERLWRGTEPESHDLERLWDAAEGLLAEGVPASDRELREILAPVVTARDEEELIGKDRASLAPLWREMEKHFAEKEERAVSSAVSDAAAELSPVVLQVRRLLEGKRVLMIGGLRRANHQGALEQVFGLEALIWPDTRAHQSIEDFEADVRHERTALVLLAIRWSSHSFGDVERLCDRWGKPFVRLPAGYNPEQVAAQIIQQASGKLANSSSEGNAIGSGAAGELRGAVEHL
jgi:hypothetical protein